MGGCIRKELGGPRSADKYDGIVIPRLAVICRSVATVLPNTLMALSLPELVTVTVAAH